jgi:hypothetical protein
MEQNAAQHYPYPDAIIKGTARVWKDSKGNIHQHNQKNQFGFTPIFFIAVKMKISVLAIILLI